MQDERRKRQEHLLTAISLFVFIIFFLFVISVRSADIYHSDENLQNINDFTGVLGGWPLGLRAGGAWLAMGTEYVLRAVSRLFIVTPIEFPLYTGANWSIWTITLERMDGFIVPLLSNYTYKIILLLPIWACIRILFRGPFSQILACIIVGSALGGWGPYIANLFFFVAKQVSDWPVYYGRGCPS